METAPAPANEAERLAKLNQYNVLDSDAEEAFDRITRFVANLLDVPIALVSLVDAERQWFKSHYGLEARETHRDLAFCAHAIHHDEIFVVPDASKDRRFSDNPLVIDEPSIRFYAGAPLITPDGYRMGTLCAIDRRPRELTEDQKQLLQDFSIIVVDQLELKLARRKADAASRAKSIFLANISHEVRTPMNAIIGFSQMIKLDAPNEEIGRWAEKMYDSADHLLNLLTDILDLSKLDATGISLNLAPMKLSDPMSQSEASVSGKLIDQPIDLRITVDERLSEHYVADKVRLSQILINLVDNASKFTTNGRIDLSASLEKEQGTQHIVRFDVVDTGSGITNEEAVLLFEPFFQSERGEPSPQKGVGLGLAICKRLVETMGGEIGAYPNEGGVGSTFWFTLPLTPVVK